MKSIKQKVKSKSGLIVAMITAAVGLVSLTVPMVAFANDNENVNIGIVSPTETVSVSDKVSLFNSYLEISEEIASGMCGDNAVWVLDDTGTLTISGSGAITSSPWRSQYKLSIKTVVINSGITKIANYSFWGCTNLTSVSLPDTVTEIGQRAFEECSITSITIPNSVTLIDDCAFELCKKLTSINIPDSVTKVGKYAFNCCTALTSVTIGKSVNNIGNYAFATCTSLTDVYYSGTWCEWEHIEKGAYYDSYFLNAAKHYGDTRVHPWSTELSYDDEAHYYKCTLCGEEKDVENHSFTNYVSNNDATCTADGTKTAKCDVCDATDTVVDLDTKLGHTWSLLYNEDSHYYKCTLCGEETDAENHSFTNYVSNNDATCTADGTKTAKCDVCDATDTVVVPKLGHNYENGVCTKCGVIKPTALSNPRTGDSTNYIFWIALLVISGTTAAVILVNLRRKSFK
ncbi:MAG: leucine-rich repeat domain-containing protein [Firmicutes bacterium]|nr:leucine-rich repeat domain-containing protein [Bacillota bacterium]